MEILTAIWLKKFISQKWFKLQELFEMIRMNVNAMPRV